MRRWLIFLLPFVWSLTPRSIVQAQSDPASEVVQLVNELRASNGLPAYQVDPVLMSVAQAQASWSAENNYIGHAGPDGSSPNDRAQAAGYGGGAKSFATENAAHGTASINTPQLVVAMWQSDWGHLSAMISPDYENIGVGYAEAGGYSWYVMMVGWVAGDSDSGDAQPQETPEAALVYSPFILSEPDENGAIYHEVQPGQSAWTIAAHYGVDLAELLALNNLTEESILHPGDVLLVRPPQFPTRTATTDPGIAAQTPTAGPPTPRPSPTPGALTVTDTSSRSGRMPIFLAVAFGIALLAGIALAGTRDSRGKVQE